ncbi:hypothetical protein JCGZ_10664 [Jatropha curcas]|uniref:Glycosyltransferase n=1 Tax=Jatropha curcas TaxID=180498 RepID=A0A067KS75_JATCU|nr:UDP-glycosyltransferase 74E1 [Jatropha curcas]KDP35130.1 hypothetical protein JCGZ_10664 [Jatropha curcas]
MERNQIAVEIHVIALPFPAQGHINPMLQFSKRLASKGLKVTLVTFLENENLTKLPKHSSNITIESISDNNAVISTVEEYWKNFSSMVEQKLVEMVEKQNKFGKHMRSCLVYDSIIPWALDIAKQLGLSAASFFTQSCAVSAIYYHVREGKINVPIEQDFVSLEGMPQLESHDLPSSRYNSEDQPSFISLMTGQFSNLKDVDWIVFSSFNSLEEEVMNWLATQYPIKLVGPTIPSRYLDNRLEDDDDDDYGLSLFKSNTKTLIEWLDSKETSSVVYVAFGSLAALGEKQMEEVANGLKRSDYHFLWVVRESEEKKLPQNFVDETSDRGLVVGWCPQLEILSHKSVGCFITHCGWNSTLEALSLGVPMVAMPQWGDQLTNAKFVTDVWRVGVRVKVNVEGLVSKEEIDWCIRQVMEGEPANEIRKNSEKWKNLARVAVGEGGSSDMNIDEFVKQLQSYWN